MEVAMNKIIPGSWTNDGTFRHTMEGEDDMPGHVKSSLMGVSLNIPVSFCFCGRARGSCVSKYICMGDEYSSVVSRVSLYALRWLVLRIHPTKMVTGKRRCE